MDLIRPAAFVRKTAKPYGTRRVAEGLRTLAGLNVCIVEDVITTGGQVILSADDLRREGAIVIISSIAALRGNSMQGMYGICKAADIQLVRDWIAQGAKNN